MTFKAAWEKTDQSTELPAHLPGKMLALAFPGKNLTHYETIAGGCANLNLKVFLEDESTPYILRIYLRDKEAAYREQKLEKRLKKVVPIPTIYFVGNFEGYRFAVAEFLPGITLRDLLLGNEPCDIDAIMSQVGSLLARIHQQRFQGSGFFDRGLQPLSPFTQDGYIEFVSDCLKNKKVTAQLGTMLVSRIKNSLLKNRSFFPSGVENHLVHADFDPANILVFKQREIWKISGVLDWEFAFSGSSLCDVANMLRYAHQMPPEFEEAFLRGLKQGGFTLPDSWRISTHMLNLLSLLDCLVRSDSVLRPKQCADICDLIRRIVGYLP